MSSTHLALAVGALAVASTLSYAQKPVAFNHLSSSYVGNPNTAYSMDLNNDGRPDIIQDFPEYPGLFLVTLNHGDGTFAGTRSYSMPGVDTPYLPMTFGDFNRDGKVDIAVAPAGGPTVYIFFGVGDGTFQQPPKSIPIPLPSGQQLGAASIAAADFNHDGRLDLVVTTTNGTNPAGVWVLPGDGDGSFTTPMQIFSAPPGQWLNDVLIGDFDSDNNADIALDYYQNNFSGPITQTTIHVLYGDGKFNFFDQFVQGLPGVANIGVGHLDRDSQEDMFALDYSTNELITFYGAASGRTFNVYYQSISTEQMPRRNAGYAPLLATADFNDDGIKDLVSIAYPLGNGGPQYLDFFLSNGARGQFTVQQVALGGTYTTLSAPMVGDFNGDTKPDVAVVQSKLTGSTSGPPVQAVTTTAINGTSNGVWSNCAYPHAGQGINVCSPVSYSDYLTHFNATAASFGNIRKMELWIDGRKHAEQFFGWGQHYAYLNWFERFSDQNFHNATIYAVDVDNRLQRYDFGFSTGYQYPCPVPSTEGISVCSPASGSTTTSTVNVEASTKVPDSSYRMELWVDGTKKYTNFNTPYLSTNIYVGVGQHRYDFYVIGASGTRLTQTIYSSSR